LSSELEHDEKKERRTSSTIIHIQKHSKFIIMQPQVPIPGFKYQPSLVEQIAAQKTIHLNFLEKAAQYSEAAPGIHHQILALLNFYMLDDQGGVFETTVSSYIIILNDATFVNKITVQASITIPSRRPYLGQSEVPMPVKRRSIRKTIADR